MQIRLAIGEQDSRYLNNLVMYLEKNHIEQVEIVSFSKPEMLREYFVQGSADVILADAEFGITAEELVSYGKAAFLSDEDDGNAGDGVRRIARFKKPELIYKDILDIYAEAGRRTVLRKNGKQTGQIVLVTGFSGGTGASAFAAALARNYASKNKKVLYLNLETTGLSTDFFSGTGTYHFEDVIFALKSQRTDIRLKMESSVRQDVCGVNFFAPCTNAMYMLELTHEDVMKIIDTLSSGCGYDRVVIDMDFCLNREFAELMDRMDQIIVVQDGGETSDSKFLRTMEALCILEQQNNLHLTDHMKLLYNRFSSSKSSAEIPNPQMPVIGKIPPIKHALVQEIIQYMLTRTEIFDAL